MLAKFRNLLRRPTPADFQDQMIKRLSAEPSVLAVKPAEDAEFTLSVTLQDDNEWQFYLGNAYRHCTQTSLSRAERKEAYSHWLTFFTRAVPAFVESMGIPMRRVF